MPIYEYRDEVTGEVLSEVYVSWRDAPKELTNPRTGNRAVRIISVPARPVVMGDNQQRLRNLEKRGVVPVESGMDRDVERAKAYREERENRRRDQVIADTLAQF